MTNAPAITAVPVKNGPFAGLDRRGTGDCLFVPTDFYSAGRFYVNETVESELLSSLFLIVLILWSSLSNAHIREHFLSVEASASGR